MIALTWIACSIINVAMWLFLLERESVSRQSAALGMTWSSLAGPFATVALVMIFIAWGLYMMFWKLTEQVKK